MQVEEQTVKTLIRLLLEEQSDLGLHCLPRPLNFRTDRSEQTVQTQIRLLLEEQSDRCLHCLLFPLHLFNEIPLGLVWFGLVIA